MDETTTAVKERPVIFSGPMVRAILDGRKTQTRRVIFKGEDSQHHMPWRVSGTHWQDGDAPLRCPYGEPGDHLWVRETWGKKECREYDPTGGFSTGTGECWVVYRAGGEGGYGEPDDDRWRPSIHMPRWASRLTLEVTEVRVERLQNITPNDAVAEGIEDFAEKNHLRPYWTTAFSRYWETINGKRPGCSWQVNPWVWVVTFQRLEAPRG